MKRAARLWLGLILLGSPIWIQCGRQAAPPAAPVPPGPAAQRAQVPWRWHAVGGVLVIEGELEEPEQLTLKGTTLDEACRAPLGPVRWELTRPPRGEVAELRGEDGRLLAKWDFDFPQQTMAAGSPASAAPTAAAAAPAPAPPAAPAPAQAAAKPLQPLVSPSTPPAVLPAGPWVRIEPHLPLPKAPKVQAPPKVAAQPPPAVRPAPAPPAGPWVRIEPHLPLPKAPRVQAPPKVAAQPPPAVRPAPAPPAGPWVRVEPHLPLPKAPRVQAPPKVAAQPPPAVRPAPAPPPGPWVRIEPHLPLPKAPRVQAPLKVAAQPPPAVRPAPAPPAGPWVRIEPHLPLPKAPRVQAPPKVAAQPPPAVRPAPAPPAGPWVRVEPHLPVPPPGSGTRASLQPSLGPIPPPPPAAPILPLPPPPRPAPVQPLSPSPPAPAQPEEASRDWPGAGEALNLLRGPKGRRWICMTFDGGSTAEVAEDVLNVLKEHGIRTTLFLTGDFIRKYPDLVRRMAREGHELGNHTLNHPHFAPHMKRDPQWTRERFQKELLDADRAFYQLLGRPMDPYWRAPYGEQTPELRRWAEELGYRHVGWSEGADSLDWATVKEFNLYRSGGAIIERLEKRMRKNDGDGLIVLMHLGSLRPAMDRPAMYLGPFMDRALKDGWHFVAIGDYLKAMGRPAWEPSRRVARINQGAGPDSP